ncbi:MAG: DNA alkylation repair protein [Treponema sp.]|nr:DNA alkylation repair protein [Treponema sp.]
MNTTVEKDIQKQLFALKDTKYRIFQCRLMPNIAPERVIGVRTPALRTLAKEIAKTPCAAEFISVLPHEYYEENNLHGFIIETIKDFDEAVRAVEEFLPYVDNWATCDQIKPKAFKKNIPELYNKIKEWIKSGRTYTVRFGLEMLMNVFLDENFIPESLKLVSLVRSDEYYVNMMVAWYFATALAKQYEATVPYIEKNKLDIWVHNKAIQKAVESYRITAGQKQYLRTLKRV